MIPEGAFDGLVNLSKLHLRSNKIETIENISQLTKLESLHLGCNNISRISGLESLTSLKYLDLMENRLKEIDEGLKSQSNSLKQLEIFKNQINNWSSIEYLGKTLKACSVLLIHSNPIC